MKKLFCILSCLLAAGCTSFEGNPYGDTLRSLSVQVVYPEEYASFLREGVPVKLTDRNSSNVYTALTAPMRRRSSTAPSNRWTSPARTGM